MARKLLISVVVGALLAGCATDTDEARTSATSSSPTPAAHSGPVAIELPHLPSQGFVVEEWGGLTFLGIDGGSLYRLEGYRLYYEWTVPGPVIVRRGKAFYLLDVSRHVLKPFDSPQAASAAAPQFQDGLELPLPPHPAGTEMSGLWAYALRSPDGKEVLAQWSGECEVPTAFLIVHGVPRPVTGEPNLSATPPNSVALGWSARGDALVYLQPNDACGQKREPGIYAFRGPGNGKLLYPVHTIRSEARMWGSG